MNMGFWKNVEERRNFIGLSRKELAQKSGIKYAVIGAGLERDSIPAANTALKIAKVLHVPLENLLDDDFSKLPECKDLPSYLKKESVIKDYWNVIEDLQSLPKNTRQSVIELIHSLAKG